MILHLFKLIWNRRRANTLIFTELLAAYLVLATLGCAAAFYLYNFRQPIGIVSEGVWVAGIHHGISRREGTPPDKLAEAMADTKRVLETVRDLPQVQAVATAVTGPYVSGMHNTSRLSGDEIPPSGQGLLFDIDHVSDDFDRVFGLTVTSGRWFGRQDDGANYLPIVLNEKMAHDFFGNADPLGQHIGRGDHDLPLRVVGVVAGYRQKGELAPPLRYMFRRYVPGHPDELPYHKLFVKTRPRTGADFEEILEKRLDATINPTWSTSVSYLPEVRTGVRKVELIPLVAAAILAGFLMLMVVLGLTGVLWQNVTQRTREIGLRRAKGATRPFIYAQILGELLVMTSLAIGVGATLLAHVPFLNLVEDMNATIYILGGGSAALVLLVLTVLCGYTPARLAARVEPALALRTE